jgi:hypothetical protein
LCIAMLFFSFHEFIYFLAAKFSTIKFKKNKRSLMSRKHNVLIKYLLNQKNTEKITNAFCFLSLTW